MLKILLPALAVACTATIAAEKSVPVDFQNFGGSSLTLAGKDSTIKTFYNEDGTFIAIDASAPKGEWTAKGNWSMREKSLCTRYIESKIQHEVDTTETCLPIQVSRYGESWSATDLALGEVRITLGQEQTDVPF